MIRLTLSLSVRSGKAPSDPYVVYLPSGKTGVPATDVATCDTLDEAMKLVAFFRTLTQLVGEQR